ncbi:MAG: hypothetical protein K2Q01_01765, partial [Rickettsiales bacterium]|nr:hypothetical protein [Rickettsiales bacterium]
MATNPKEHSKTWSLPTGEGLPPMQITLTLGNDRKHDKYLSLNIANLGHPYLDPDKTGKFYSYVGDETKNPALIPATKHALD